jgi:hypothetical protein
MRDDGYVLTAFGATAVTFMMVMYGLEHRHRRFVLAFACGCALSSAYGFLAGTWPFGVVEAIWAVIALRRYQRARPRGMERASVIDGEQQPDQHGSGVPELRSR